MPRQRARPVYPSTSPSDVDEENDTSGSSKFIDDGSTSFEHDGDLSNLFDRLNTYVDATEGNRNLIFKDMKKAPSHIRQAMFSVLADKKEDLAPLLDNRAEAVKKINSCSEKLDNMLFDCLAGADLGPPSPEPGETAPVNDSEYKFQLQTIKIKHTEMLEELEQSRNQSERVIDNMVELQIPFRPISKLDHQRMKDTAMSRYSTVEECIKKSTVNAVMLINNKCLDARRRRRNFTKETTEVLTEWFNEHINHPYPTDEEKNDLAYQCNISVQQITNWFGNRRVRQKRQADRPLQPPSSPKKKDGPPPKNRNHLKGNRGQNRTAAQQRSTVETTTTRQLISVLPMNQQQQHGMQLMQHPPIQLPPRQSMMDHNFQMDQFEPQGMQHPTGIIMSNHYQIDSMHHSMNQSNVNGRQHMHSMEHIIGDKSYTDL